MVLLLPVDEPLEYNSNYVYYWNHVGLELNRLTHSLGGPQNGPTVSARALGILHLAIHDAYFAIKPSGSFTTYLTENDPDEEYRLPKLSPNADNPELAVAGASITVLEGLYAGRNTGNNVSSSTKEQLDAFITQSSERFKYNTSESFKHDTSESFEHGTSPSYKFGTEVGSKMLELLKYQEPQDPYMPTKAKYRFYDDPTSPVQLVPIDPNNPSGAKRTNRPYHEPFYGTTAKRFAVQMKIDDEEIEHMIADPPVGFGTKDYDEYQDAAEDVIRMGGMPLLNKTLRKPSQTAGAYFWAYDGANLIGTPPRLYNQIIRKVAWGKKPGGPTNEDTNADFARLFALANVAMADAGIFCWKEKYHFEFWRPLSGIREHEVPLRDPNDPPPCSESEIRDPFWLTLGAPRTNTNGIPFKPPFPAYPSGHATFCAAAFQILRLYYRERDNMGFDISAEDDIKFSFVSEELNGISRDLQQQYDPSRLITDQPGDVRTRDPRDFASLWEAIFENAVSRVWLGVHWRFDAFAAKDALMGTGPPYDTNDDGTTSYKNAASIRYETAGPRADRPNKMFPIGGVPLGINIANDIFGGKLRPTPKSLQPSRNRNGITAVKMVSRDCQRNFLQPCRPRHINRLFATSTLYTRSALRGVI